MSSDPVEIALASENNYFCGLIVTAASIARHANKDCALSFTILDTGMSDENFNLLVTLVRGLHVNSSFRRVQISDKLLEGFPDWHGNKTSFARLLLPKIMPSNITHVIYSDVDFLWLCDICELWNLRDENTPYISARDVNEVVKNSENAWFESIGVSVDMKKYFCAGLSFFNLEAFRREGLDGKAIAFIGNHPDVGSADQTALNAILNGRQKLVEQRWQVFSRDSPVEDIRPPCAIHYAGEPPWKFSRKTFMLTDVQLLWFRFDASIRKISVWKSLRQHYNIFQIVAYRINFLCIIGIRPFRMMFDAFLRATGRWGFREWMPKAQFKELMDFLSFQ